MPHDKRHIFLHKTNKLVDNLAAPLNRFFIVEKGEYYINSTFCRNFRVFGFFAYCRKKRVLIFFAYCRKSRVLYKFDSTQTV